jgi:hypothetical protein
MGYMGFGMRKENYTRRPVKRFLLWKERLPKGPSQPTEEFPTSKQAADPSYGYKDVRRWHYSDFIPGTSPRVWAVIVIAVALALVVLTYGTKMVVWTLGSGHQVP